MAKKNFQKTPLERAQHEKAVKVRKMTAKEKAERAKIKKELQADGIIPLDKKPLNRKKFQIFKCFVQAEKACLA